jgi:short-subunit dehydrogenase
MPLPPPDPTATCLVTGASAGIGADIARELARRGYGVTLVARREDRLRALARELREGHGVRAEPFVCDVADLEQRAALEDAVAALGLRVDLVVNNAGFGSQGRFHRLEAGHQVDMVRTLVEAVVALCGTWVPPMVERGAGAVLNVASTAAFQPVPLMTTYSAAKAFVLSFTEALGEDLRGTGVTATALCPGPVDTEFSRTTEPGAGVGRAPAWAVLGSEEVARAGVAGVLAGRRTVVPGRLHAAGALGGRLAPRSVLLPLIRRLHPAAR